MQSNEALISGAGFDYILEESQKNISRLNLNNILDSLYGQNYAANPQIYSKPENKSNSNKIRDARKMSQYLGFMNVLNNMGMKGNVLEIGSGNGDLATLLADNFQATVIGVDIKDHLISKLNKSNTRNNLRFLNEEYFKYSNKNFNWVIGLHSCGNLTDKVIDLGIECSSDIVCVPCCYGSINKKEQIMPRSIEMKKKKEKFNYVFKKLNYLDGFVNDSGESTFNTLREIYRRLVDFDRIFYLKEKGYHTQFSKITEKTVILDDQKYATSSLCSAIIASKK